MKYADIRTSILKKIRPTLMQERRLEAAVGDMLGSLWAAAALLELDVELFVGGSTAKGTWLRGDHDVDLFVRFGTRHGKDVLSDLLEEALKRTSLDYERIHGSRDYFQFRHCNILFEIVPVLRVNKPAQAQNVTDMSPLHVTYVNERLNARMRDEIRLAKRFCKAARVYGAESYRNGFSGHVLDLLILEYGSFQKLLKAASKWPTGEKLVIDPASHHKNPLKAIDKAKTHTPLVVVDPVQPERNAAAALSLRQYFCFITAAQAFLEKPSLVAFTPRPLAIPAGAVAVMMSALKGKDDVVGAKCLKAFEHLAKQAKLNGFTILLSDWDYDPKAREAIGYLLVEEKRLPATYEYSGPPLHAKKDAQRFRQKHKAAKHPVKEEEGRLYATITREHRTLKALLRAAAKGEYVKGRTVRTVTK